MAKYEKKCVQANFQSIWDGARSSDIRKNHTDYKVGDIIAFREVRDTKVYSKSHNSFIGSEEYTGRSVNVKVTHVAKDLPGMKIGRCLVTFIPISKTSYDA